MNEREVLVKLSSLVARPEWDMFMVYIAGKLSDERETLEICQPEFLRVSQAKVSVYKDILTLRDTVAMIIKDTKPQS